MIPKVRDLIDQVRVMAGNTILSTSHIGVVVPAVLGNLVFIAPHVTPIGDAVMLYAYASWLIWINRMTIGTVPA
jgi:hypothetical protein